MDIMVVSDACARMTNNKETARADHDQITDDSLLGIEACLKRVFKDENSRPGIRTFNEWRAKGYYPYHKIGKRVYLSPVAVRKALDKRFIIEAID
jgi:hypothetical protein